LHVAVLSKLIRYSLPFIPLLLDLVPKLFLHDLFNLPLFSLVSCREALDLPLR
jgi:hypothetical protein